MKKIAVIIDIKIDSGGGLGMCLAKINYLNKIETSNITFITTYKSTSNILSNVYKIKNIFFNKNNIFNKFKNLFFKLKINNYSSLESFLNSLNINKVFFISPSYLNILIKELDYIYTIWDLSHLDKKLAHLPEHDAKTIRIRERSYKEAARKAKFIVIGTEENKKFFYENYNCDLKKLAVIKFLPFLCLLKKQSFLKKQLVKFENYLLYPAQYWEHKNHKFLIDFFDEYKFDNSINKIMLVCTGHDKGCLNKLQNIIKVKNLNNIKLLGFVSDEELISLYNNAMGVIFPSLIGSHSFPLYEAFYFQKPVFYNEKILSNELKKYVYLIDVSSKKSLYKKILNFLEDDKKKNQITLNAKKKFDEIFDEKKIIDNLKYLIT